MTKRELTVMNEEGLHSRPAMEFSKLAESYSSEIEIEKDGETFDAKSMLMVLAACICRGDRFVLRAEGTDETQAIEGLSHFVENLKE